MQAGGDNPNPGSLPSHDAFAMGDRAGTREQQVAVNIVGGQGACLREFLRISAQGDRLPATLMRVVNSWPESPARKSAVTSNWRLPVWIHSPWPVATME